jgi:hypothetical protein
MPGKQACIQYRCSENIIDKDQTAGLSADTNSLYRCQIKRGGQSNAQLE